MTTVPLGNSNLHISRIGLGTWAMGGEGDYGWGPQDDAHSIGAIHRAVESGINWIDTAPIYGFGRSEEVVGRAVKDLGNSQRPYVFSKCGLIWDEQKNAGHSLRADSIRNEVDASLRRLQIDVLDLCQIHWPSFPPGSPDPDLEEGWATLAELVAQGKIRYLGASNFNVTQLARVRSIAPIASLQPPYSMLVRGIEEEVLPCCQRHTIGVIGYSPMHHGLLSGTMSHARVASMPPSDWRATHSPAFREPHLSRNLALAETLRSIGNRHGRSAGEVAIAWTLRHPAVTGSIVGARSAAQVDGFLGAVDLRLSDDEIVEVERGLPDAG